MKPKDYYTSEIVTSNAGINRALEDRALKSIEMKSAIKTGKGSKSIDIGCGDGKFLNSLSLKLKLTSIKGRQNRNKYYFCSGINIKSQRIDFFASAFNLS